MLNLRRGWIVNIIFSTLNSFIKLQIPLTFSFLLRVLLKNWKMMEMTQFKISWEKLKAFLGKTFRRLQKNLPVFISNWAVSTIKESKLSTYKGSNSHFIFVWDPNHPSLDLEGTTNNLPLLKLELYGPKENMCCRPPPVLSGSNKYKINVF